MSEFTQTVGHDETIRVSDFGGTLSSLSNEGSSSNLSEEYNQLFRYAKKLQEDGELERSLRLKYLCEMNRLSFELQRIRKLFRRDKKAAKKPQSKPIQKPPVADDDNFSALRVDKGLFLETQQLRRDLKISDEDRRNLRKEVRAQKKVVGERDETIENLNHQLSILRKKIFGKSAERGIGKEIAKRISDKSDGKKKRQKSPKRRKQEALPIVEVHSILEGEDLCCKSCGLEYCELNQSDISDQLELKVEAYRKRLVRHKYKRSCSCPASPIFQRGPLPAKIFPASLYGDSIWEHLLVEKFLFQMPIQRIVASLKATGLDLSMTTVNDGLLRFWNLLEPLEKHLAAQSRKDGHWHCDETGWSVYEGPGTCRVNRSWYLWTILSKTVSMFYIKKSRGSDVVNQHFSDEAQGIISSDRFSVYRKYELLGRFSVAYCWAHTRRDFIRVLDADGSAEVWGTAWLKIIAAVFQLANQRRRNLDKPELVGRLTTRIKRLLKYIEIRSLRELSGKSLTAAQRKTLVRMQKHWKGLQVFVEHPELAIDNNAAERSLRIEVVGRKNYYGSGSEWSASFASLMFSVFQTLKIWQINERLWLREAFAYIREAKADNLYELLPWNLSDGQKMKFKMTNAFNSS